MARFVFAAKVSDVPSRTVKAVKIGDKSIALFNLGGEFYAIDDECTHEGGPLSEGLIEGDEVECPWHGARFDIRSGTVTLDPAVDDLPTYKVRVQGDDIEIEI